MLAIVIWVEALEEADTAVAAIYKIASSTVISEACKG